LRSRLAKIDDDIVLKSKISQSKNKINGKHLEEIKNIYGSLKPKKKKKANPVDKSINYLDVSINNSVVKIHHIKLPSLDRNLGKKSKDSSVEISVDMGSKIY
jgi:hypothetical protein